MASSLDLKPWCAARKCPVSPQGCAGYIAENFGNKTTQSFVACCQIQCGANEWLMGLECGGATTGTAAGIMLYLVVLLVAGGYILALGPFLKLKNVTFWIIVVGSLIFTTGTGVFVTVVTSPFIVLQTVPALGAMNVAIFSYFYSGFRYGVGLAYEGGPLVVFASTSFTIWKALVESSPGAGPIRTANRLALAMLVFTFLWIVHSISYRLYGYRVDWRLGHRWPKHGDNQDPRFHLGAAQGHPTWRTPLGQSTSVVMTALAWAMVGVVRKDLALQKCRPDWSMQAMLYGAPCLISVTILWNVFSGIRCRTIEGLKYTVDNNVGTPQKSILRAIFERPLSLVGYSFGPVLRVQVEVEKKSEYPGYSTYKYFVDSNFLSGKRLYVWTEYVQAAALQRMERNSLFVEDVPESRLHFSDKAIGFVSWLLAQGGLVISAPGFFLLMAVAALLRRLFEAVDFRLLVVTEVNAKDRERAVEEIEQCYVGANLGVRKMDWDTMEVTVLGQRTGTRSTTIPGAQRSVNLHTLLDNTGPCELYNVLTLPGLQEPLELEHRRVNVNP